MSRRRRAREGQEKRKREDRRPIPKKLCATLLRSFRGQHSKKIKGSAQGNWDPRKGQQPFRPNPNGAGDRTTTLRWLLIGAELILLSQSTHKTSSLAFPSYFLDAAQINFSLPQFFTNFCFPSTKTSHI